MARATAGYPAVGLFPGFLRLTRLLLAGFLHLVTSNAAPIAISEPSIHTDAAEKAELWIYLSTAIGLVLLGGAFAGLTIALMGQDEIYLQVIATTEEGSERKNADKVLRLLKRGKHWVLVTLLVGNVITNETLPIVLDRSIGGGYAAAISSTVLVIIFGEIVPQSICVRYGLPIGAWMANFVLLLMFIFAPITWPIAKLLDRLLGQDHGTTYKKNGLKSLVTLHKTVGDAAAERLNEDEVAIITGVLDLKAKPVGSIMTPMNDVFTLPSDAVLDEEMINKIMREGYSRIPIHEPHNKSNFLGMLLVKLLITYDPEDEHKVRDLALATLPETLPQTSCLDIINFFQEGKSHMVLVSDFPGENHGVLGVVTLEDVIEELIGEEIIDESDVFVDVHKAIRRLQPAPLLRTRGQNRSDSTYDSTVCQTDDGTASIDESKENSVIHNPEHDEQNNSQSQRPSFADPSEYARSPQAAHFMMRRRSSAEVSEGGSNLKSVHFRPSNVSKLGPSNVASRPKSTRFNSVKIKPSVGTINENTTQDNTSIRDFYPSVSSAAMVTTPPTTAAQGGIGQDLLKPNRDAKDGVQAVVGYGSIDRSGAVLSTPARRRETSASDETPPKTDDVFSTPGALPQPNGQRVSPPPVTFPYPNAPRHSFQRSQVRSGSITENLIDCRGVQKLVLQTNSTSEDSSSSSASSPRTPTDERCNSQISIKRDRDNDRSGHGSMSPSRVKPGEVLERNTSPSEGKGDKKKKKKRGGKKRKSGKKSGGSTAEEGGDENTPLLK